MRLRRIAPLGLVLCCATPGVAQQVTQPGQRTCDIVYSGRIDNNLDMATFLDPFAFHCTDGTDLSASQGTLNKTTREIHLVGDVHYSDPTRTLTAQDAIYNNEIGRLYATGNVVFTDQTQGMTLRGPELEYYKVMLPSRPQAQVNAGQRPHLTLVPKAKPEPGAAPAAGAASKNNNEPLEIDGDRMALVGENDLSMFGNVVIVRPDMRATAGEARYNGTTEGLELRQNAQIHNEDYTLRGEVIQARMPGGQLEHVESHTNAFLQGKDLTVTSAELQMFFEGGALQRTVARGGGKGVDRPLAHSKTFRLQADSLDALMPAQQLQKVIAIGDARGESVDTTRADSTRADSARANVPGTDNAAARVASAPATSVAPARADSAARGDTTTAAVMPSARSLVLSGNDWIVGDTITGFFATAPDTAKSKAKGAAGKAAGAKPDSTVELQRIVARGNALSLYRVQENGKQTKPGSAAQSDTAQARKGINFLSGSEIELTFEGGELKVADVKGLEKGLYLDPSQPPRPAPAKDGSTEPAKASAPPGGNG
jgi:lipopolysaccharide export system protein LptA